MYALDPESDPAVVATKDLGRILAEIPGMCTKASDTEAVNTAEAARIVTAKL